jgi:hypothetical protein
MQRLKSLQDVLDHKDTINPLAYLRGIQFCGSSGYDADIDGWIVEIHGGDDLTQIKEIGVNEYADILDHCEFVASFDDADRVVFEVVFQLDDSRTVAVIIPDEPWLDPGLRTVLIEASGSPLPLPTLESSGL